jgi:hypothetical protein
MRHPSQSGFSTVRRSFEALCFCGGVALLALAVGFVLAVIVLTKPTRSALVFSTVPAVAWNLTERTNP